MKQYAVEVLESRSHGRYGKAFYFGMYLPGFNKKDAEAVGMETLAAMTFDEIDNRCINDYVKPWHDYTKQDHERKHGKDAAIGFELAARFFSCRAYIEGNNND